MKASIRSFLAVVLALAVVASVVSVANVPRVDAQGTEETTSPLTVDIESPLDGEAISGGSTTVAGVVQVGGEEAAQTSLVLAVDVSRSTIDRANGDCGGDLNGDRRSDTILDCEIAAVEALEAESLASGVLTRLR